MIADRKTVKEKIDFDAGEGAELTPAQYDDIIRILGEWLIKEFEKRSPDCKGEQTKTNISKLT